jgi:hypothetical protein
MLSSRQICSVLRRLCFSFGEKTAGARVLFAPRVTAGWSAVTPFSKRAIGEELLSGIEVYDCDNKSQFSSCNSALVQSTVLGLIQYVSICESSMKVGFEWKCSALHDTNPTCRAMCRKADPLRGLIIKLTSLQYFVVQRHEPSHCQETLQRRSATDKVFQERVGGLQRSPTRQHSMLLTKLCSYFCGRTLNL